jgi:hypothetical protein
MGWQNVLFIEYWFNLINLTCVITFVLTARHNHIKVIKCNI